MKIVATVFQPKLSSVTRANAKIAPRSVNADVTTYPRCFFSEPHSSSPGPLGRLSAASRRDVKPFHVLDRRRPGGEVGHEGGWWGCGDRCLRPSFGQILRSGFQSFTSAFKRVSTPECV